MVLNLLVFAVLISGSIIELKSVYTEDDLKDRVPKEKLGKPGDYPFTRGIHPGMYRTRFWTQRQLAGFGVPAQTSERVAYLTKEGQTGPSFIFDAPTRWGLDSDDFRAKGAVGRVGVALDTLQDMEDLLSGVDLTQSIYFTESAVALVVLAMFLSVAEKRGVALESLKGSLQNDILKEYTYGQHGMNIVPPEAGLKIFTDIVSYCSKFVPDLTVCTISAEQMREAGANAMQELAIWYSFAHLYIEKCIECGLNVDVFATKFASFFGAKYNLFEEIAMYRAARRMWARMLKEQFSATNPQAMKLRFHVQTCGSALTAQQPLNNIVRGTLECLAAVLGGAQSIGISCFDEGLEIPSELSHRVALRIQQIIAEESGAGDVVDPLGGSYFIEWLTDRMEAGALEIVRTIEDSGGPIAVIRSGLIRRMTTEELYKNQSELEKGERVVVGLNKYCMDEKVEVKLFEPDPETEKK